MRAERFASIACVALLALAGCATTRQDRSVEPSGFLKNYDELQPGESGEALLLYIDPGADFSAFDRVIIDPVTIWTKEGSDAGGAPREELQQLADALETALRNQLAHDYTIVPRPEPGTLRIRTALTEAQKSKVVLDIVSTVLPPARITGLVGRLATGTYAFVGTAAIEMEIVDAVSGRRLLAAADQRSGRKTLSGSTDEWSDVNEAFDYWANAVRSRLAMMRDFDRAEGEVDQADEEVDDTEAPAEASD